MALTNVYPCILAHQIISKGFVKGKFHYKPCPVIFLGDADVFYEPQYERIFYSLAKMTVHSLVMTIFEEEKKEKDNFQIEKIIFLS